METLSSEGHSLNFSKVLSLGDLQGPITLIIFLQFSILSSPFRLGMLTIDVIDLLWEGACVNSYVIMVHPVQFHLFII